jgi:hypothetical protein
MMQLVLIVLTKRKETIRYCASFGYGGTTLSNNIANDLTHISVPVEGGFNHPHHGHFASSPSWAFHSMSYS